MNKPPLSFSKLNYFTSRTLFSIDDLKRSNLQKSRVNLLQKSFITLAPGSYVKLYPGQMLLEQKS